MYNTYILQFPSSFIFDGNQLLPFFIIVDSAARSITWGGGGTADGS